MRELEGGTTDLRRQGFAYARPFGEWILENAMRKFLKLNNSSTIRTKVDKKCGNKIIYQPR